MVKQKAFDALCKCLEEANGRNEHKFNEESVFTRLKLADLEKRTLYRLTCGFRTGHRLSVISIMPAFAHKDLNYYTFKCIDCRLEYTVHENFTDREQELIDNLKKGVSK